MACNRYEESDKELNEEHEEGEINEEYMELESICNYYGILTIRRKEGVFEWGLGDWSGMFWEEIPENLYSELKKYWESRSE